MEIKLPPYAAVAGGNLAGIEDFSNQRTGKLPRKKGLWLIAKNALCFWGRRIINTKICLTVGELIPQGTDFLISLLRRNFSVCFKTANVVNLLRKFLQVGIKHQILGRERPSISRARKKKFSNFHWVYFLEVLRFGVKD
jgi:hypothetical protein